MASNNIFCVQDSDRVGHSSRVDGYSFTTKEKGVVTIPSHPCKELLLITEYFNHGKCGGLKAYPGLDNAYSFNFTRKLKEFFTPGELQEFFMFLKVHAPWTFMCLTKETRKGEGVKYRGFIFYTIEMSARKTRHGLYEQSSSWVKTDGGHRPSHVIQVEIASPAPKGSKWGTKATSLYFGYVTKTYLNLTQLMDILLVREELI